MSQPAAVVCKPLLVTGLLAIVLTATAGLPLRAQSGFDYHSFTGEIVWRGTQALKLCNGLFVSSRRVDQIYAQEFGGMGDPMPRARVEIDQRARTVAVGVGGTDQVPAMRSAYREGIGCVVMAPDQTFSDIDKLPILRTPPLPGDPSSVPWPDGDRLEKKPLPRGVNDAGLAAAGDWAFDRVAHEAVRLPGGPLASTGWSRSQERPRHAGQVTLSLLVVQDGDILYERYASGVDMYTRTRTWSTAKSITSTLIGIAVGKGLLKLNEPLPFDWRPDTGKGAPDPRRRITLRQVLHMSSGLYPGRLRSHAGSCHAAEWSPVRWTLVVGARQPDRPSARRLLHVRRPRTIHRRGSFLRPGRRPARLGLAAREPRPVAVGSARRGPQGFPET